jgi:glycosyltransferase involved in cell wall biosynthesis
MNNQMALAVIVLTYNNDNALLKTLQSIKRASLKSESVYVVIVDGGGGSAYQEAVNFFSREKLILHKAPDNGIFDAMNIGFRLAPEGWVTYLNSGDVYDPTLDLESLITGNNDLSETWLVGNAQIDIGSSIQNWKIPKKGSLKFKLGLNSYPHQSTFYNKTKVLSLFNQPFETKNSVADWSLSYALANIQLPKILDYQVSINEKAGASRQVKLRTWALDVVHTREKLGELITKNFKLDLGLQIVVGFLSRTKNRLRLFL